MRVNQVTVSADSRWRVCVCVCVCVAADISANTVFQLCFHEGPRRAPPPPRDSSPWRRRPVNRVSLSLHQLLRGVTISNGGVLPRIHPELLSKKRGIRVKVDSPAAVPEKKVEQTKSKKPVKSFKKGKGKRGRKPKVSGTPQGGGALWVPLPLSPVCRCVEG